MTLKKFEEFIKKSLVRKQRPDRNRAESLIRESDAKFLFLKSVVKNLPSENMNHNFVVECCYDILIELLRAKMFVDGFNSKNSHEAEVSYMFKLYFSEIDIRFMDEIRYYRNGIKYYGAQMNKEYSEKVIEFMEKIRPKLKENTKNAQ